jgi:hypothetical protein
MREKKKKERIMPLIVATTLATQPVYNTGWANLSLEYLLTSQELEN